MVNTPDPVSSVYVTASPQEPVTVFADAESMHSAISAHTQDRMQNSFFIVMPFLKMNYAIIIPRLKTFVKKKAHPGMCLTLFYCNKIT